MIVNLWDLLHFIRQLHTWVPFAADSYTSNEKLLSVNSGMLSLASITYTNTHVISFIFIDYISYMFCFPFLQQISLSAKFARERH